MTLFKTKRQEDSRELGQLRKVQFEALQKARFIPMSGSESTKYDARRMKIMALMRTLESYGNDDEKE